MYSVWNTVNLWLHIVPRLIMLVSLKCTKYQITMLCNRNQHNSADQLYFKNKKKEKEIRFVVTKSRVWEKQNQMQQPKLKTSSYK